MSLTGMYGQFTTKRLIVVRMKDTEEELEDMKLKDLSQYKRFIEHNMNLLEQWSGHTFKSLLYDSDSDAKESSVFRNKVLNHSHLYFIVIDTCDNVFGHYHDSLIDKYGDGKTVENVKKNCVYDDEIFLFTLHNNTTHKKQKFERKGKLSTLIYDNEFFYRCGNDQEDTFTFTSGRISIDSFEKDRNYMKGIYNICEGTNGIEIIGYNTSFPLHF